MDNKSTKDIFEEIKDNKEEIGFEDIENIEKNLKLVIESASDLKQLALLERAIFYFEVLSKERYLIENNFNHYILKENIEELLEKLNREVNDKMIFFCELDDFPRIIPKDVVKKVKTLKDKEIFDKYYVLYTDYTEKAKKTATDGKLSDKEIEREKDPILFGAFVKNLEHSKTSIMLERLYFVADWEDELCDLTLDKLITLAPESVYSTYGDGKESFDIAEIELPEDIKEDLFKVRQYNESLKVENKKRGLLGRLKVISNYVFGKK